MKSNKIQHIVKIVLFFFSYSVLNVYRIIIVVIIITVGCLKQWRQRRRGRRVVKNEFNKVKFQMEIRKITCCRPLSVDDAELGHFMLLFWIGQQRNVQRFIMHVHNFCSLFCSLSLLFGADIVAVVVEVRVLPLLKHKRDSLRHARHQLLHEHIASSWWALT